MRETAPRITHLKKRLSNTTKLGWEAAVMQFSNHLLGPSEAMPATVLRYGRDLAKFKQWFATDPEREGISLEPSAVVGSDLRDFRDFLRNETVCVGTAAERKRKAGAVNSIMTALRSFFAWAHQARVIDEMPVMPRRVRAEKPGNKAVPPSHQKRILRIAERGRNKRDIAILMVLLDCGLRVSELVALRWRDVRLTRDAAEIYIWAGKGDKQGTVPLSDRARKALKDLAGDQIEPAAPVFTSRKGDKAITPRGVQKILESYGRLAGVKITPHMCRHACATDMLDRGEQVPTVMAVLRHRSVTTTLGYTHTTPEKIRKAVERGGDDD